MNHMRTQGLLTNHATSGPAAVAAPKLPRRPRHVPPSVTLDRDYLDFTGEESILLTALPAASCRAEELLLVVDIYRAEQPVHPQGHVGYWTCFLDRGGPVGIEVGIAQGRLGVCFHGAPACDCWVNEDLDTTTSPVLSVRVLLARPGCNTAVFEDVLLLYQDRQALEARGRSLEELAETPAWVNDAALPWFGWPADCRLRLVTHDLYSGTAVGNFAFAMRQLLRANDVPCELYASRFDPALRGLVHPVNELLDRARKQDLILLQYSVFDPYTEALAALPCRKILFFQNVTPPQFFQAYDAALARDTCGRALQQLRELPAFDALVANSLRTAADLGTLLADATDNARPIASTPQPAVHVCPPVLGMSRWDSVPAEPVVLPDGGTRLLYVGRLAPHKRVEDLFSLFEAYRRLDGDAVLLLAGAAAPLAYEQYLHGLTDRLEPAARERIAFLGTVSDGQLKTLYSSSTALVTMSEHEGFCVPLLEAFAFGVPVFAYADAAVRETLGRSGMVFHRKDFPAIAATMHAVLRDSARRSQFVAAQRRRCAELMEQADGSRLWQVFEQVLFPHARPV